MTTDQPDHSNIDYDQAVKDITKPIAAVMTKVDQNRFVTKLVVLVIAILLVGGAFGAYTLDQIGNLAQKNRATTVALAQSVIDNRVAQCNIGNNFRAADLKSWTDFLNLIVRSVNAAPASTPDSKAKTIEFQDTALRAKQKQDVLTDCTRVAAGLPIPSAATTTITLPITSLP